MIVINEGFFSFKKFITIDIIKIIYVLGLITITFGSITIASYKGVKNYLIGLGLILLGNVVWRLFCEGIAIFYSINEKLGNIEKKKK